MHYYVFFFSRLLGQKHRSDGGFYAIMICGVITLVIITKIPRESNIGVALS